MGGGENAMKSTELTKKQEKFVQELIKGKSQREAYREAYPASVNWKDNVVDVKASELKTGKVLVRYNELHDRLVKEAEDECIVSAKEVLREYAKIGFSNITDYLKIQTDEGNNQFVELYDTESIAREKMDAVAEIKQTKDGISLKLYDKKGALDSIARHLGMFNDNLNIANKDGKPFETRNTSDLSKLSVKELKELESILSKTTETD